LVLNKIPIGFVCPENQSFRLLGPPTPADDTFSAVGATISGSDRYRGGVLLPSGKVVLVPASADN
jgi:hypothetical protein